MFLLDFGVSVPLYLDLVMVLINNNWEKIGKQHLKTGLDLIFSQLQHVLALSFE